MNDKFLTPTGQRPVRTDGEARKSVVLVSTGGAQDLTRALHVLAPVTSENGAELLVAYAESDDLDAESEDALRETFPRAVFVRLPSNLSMAEVRRAGMDRSDGDIVRFVEANASLERLQINHLFSAPPGTVGSGDP